MSYKLAQLVKFDLVLRTLVSLANALKSNRGYQWQTQVSKRVAPVQKGGAKLLFGHIFAENCMKRE